jgi:hypothetical protein
MPVWPKNMHGPGIPGPCMSLECGDVSSQWEVRYVKVNPRIPCCIAFKDGATEWNSARGKVPPSFSMQGRAGTAASAKECQTIAPLLVNQEATSKLMIVVILCMDT